MCRYRIDKILLPLHDQVKFTGHTALWYFSWTFTTEMSEILDNLDSKVVQFNK